MGLLKEVPVNKVKNFESEFLEYLDLKHKDVLDNLRKGVLNSDITTVLEKVASDLVIKYRPQ
jgi:F-type H+-transporting ATPase subunit alpha